MKLAEFTPIPSTLEWERASEIYGFDPNSDPLLHNNCVFPLTIGEHRLDEWDAVKRLASDGNRRVLKSERNDETVSALKLKRSC